MKGLLYSIRLIGLFFLLILGSSLTGNAQNSSFEFWPETDIWYVLSPSWRVEAFIPITKYNESKNRDLNIYLQADYKWGKTEHSFYGRLCNENRVQQMKAWMVRAGFMEGWSLDDHAESYTEDMLFAEIHKRVPLGEKFLLSQRIRVETRWVGQDPKFSYRFRYRIMLEREFNPGKSSLVPYVNVEPYWDSRYSVFNRVRAIGGATINWGPRFAYEANVTYQYDTHYDSDNLYAINVILHVFFETKKAQAKK